MPRGRNTHWCHTCVRPIRLCSRYIICSYCAGEFVQALNDMSRSSTVNISSFGGDDFHDTQFGMMDGHSSSVSIDRVEELYGGAISFRPFSEPGRRGDLGLAGGVEFPFISSYLRERELEELIEQLGNRGVTRLQRRGPPPATKSSISAMPTIEIKQRHLHSDSHCPICIEIFDLGSKAKEMPCKHIYHSECIIPWLTQNNTCPVCRYKMPTTQGSTSTTQGSSTTSSRNRGRRNPFSFLWQRRSSPSSAQ